MKEYHTYNRSKYDILGDYGIGTTYNGDVFYFDIEDYNKIKDYNWFVNDQGYLLAYLDCQKTIRMHRIIMDASIGEEVDHKHGKNSRNDNRKDNLRIASHSQNNINKGIQKTNTSGVTGVDFVKRVSKWRARIHINGIEISLGLYDDKQDATLARKQAEDKYFGEWSYRSSTKEINNGKN